MENENLKKKCYGKWNSRVLTDTPTPDVNTQQGNVNIWKLKVNNGFWLQQRNVNFQSKYEIKHRCVYVRIQRSTFNMKVLFDLYGVGISQFVHILSVGISQYVHIVSDVV